VLLSKTPNAAQDGSLSTARTRPILKLEPVPGYCKISVPLSVELIPALVRLAMGTNAWEDSLLFPRAGSAAWAASRVRPTASLWALQAQNCSGPPIQLTLRSPEPGFLWGVSAHHDAHNHSDREGDGVQPRWAGLCQLDACSQPSQHTHPDTFLQPRSSRSCRAACFHCARKLPSLRRAALVQLPMPWRCGLSRRSFQRLADWLADRSSSRPGCGCSAAVSTVRGTEETLVLPHGVHCGEQRVAGRRSTHLNHARMGRQTRRRRFGGLTQSPVSAAGFAFALRVGRRPQREANFRPLSVQCPVGTSARRCARVPTTKMQHASHAGQPAIPKSRPARTRPSIKLRLWLCWSPLLIHRAVPRLGGAWKHATSLLIHRWTHHRVDTPSTSQERRRDWDGEQRLPGVW